MIEMGQIIKTTLYIDGKKITIAQEGQFPNIWQFKMEFKEYVRYLNGGWNPFFNSSSFEEKNKNILPLITKQSEISEYL